jgi:hypothetical protein
MWQKRRNLKCKVDGQMWDMRYEERTTADGVIRGLNVTTERSDIAALFDGDSRLDNAKCVIELSESKLYVAGLRDSSESARVEFKPAPGVNPLTGRLAALGVKCHRAAAVGDIASLKRFYGKREILNSVDEKGFAPLHAAASHGQCAAVSLLVKLGADANQAGLSGVTPILIAVYAGHLEVVRVLLRVGARGNARDDHGDTRLSKVQIV